ncbi:hypothetical protein FSP39_004398 [Pinctada imbricata]|uniref:Uncharacterized protein n=1 Tax=Pinctada imbricata TaxID=66713 RepID=A0AA89BIR3_PINIB|nr:hypothetical protein FSP39_004398 [Pinctada imbricata]
MARAKKFVNCLKDIWALKGIIVPIFAFCVPLPLILDTDSKAARCGYTVIVMAILWLTEAIPIPVTSLIPIFLLPLLGVSSAKEVSGSYVTDTSMLFLGGLIVAVAVEESGLHRRVALSILKIVGGQPNLLMFGLMLPTWFLSMWISNTAAASMMVPIITAVTAQMEEVAVGRDNSTKRTNRSNSKKFLHEESESEIGKNYDNNITLTAVTSLNDGQGIEKAENELYPVLLTEDGENQEDVMPPVKKSTSEHHGRLCKALGLSIAYAANTGGIATLTGSPPNLVLKEVADKVFDCRGKAIDGRPRSSGITFSNWMAFAFPLSFIVMILGWLWLQLFVLRCKKACGCCRKQKSSRELAIRKMIQEEYKTLGKFSFGEGVISMLFLTLAALWIFREPPNIPGWGDYFPPLIVSDSTPSIFIGVMLFILPARLPHVFCWRKNVDRSVQILRLKNLLEQTSDKKEKPYKPILEWQQTMNRLPWGVILLLGGGFALAKASKSSGLSKSVGQSMNVFSEYEPWVLNLIICSLTAAATEVTSNTATATLLMPILAELAEEVGLNPLYLMIGAAVACSFAFMLPVATPPSAIVFSNGFLTIPDMASAGLMMNIICILVLTLAINTWGNRIYSLDTIPDIFRTQDGNLTLLLSNLTSNCQ